MRHLQLSTTEWYCGATRSAHSAAAEVADKLFVGCKKSELAGGIGDGLQLSPQQLKKLKALLEVI